MSYVTKDQLIDRIGAEELVQLTDRFGDGDLDDDVLATAIADADAIIDSYLAPRYALPLAQALIDASPLARVAGDIARYALYTAEAPDEVRNRHADALRWLRDVQAGRASLGRQDTVDTAPGTITRDQGVSAFDWDGY